MIWSVAIAAGALVAAGVYLTMSRDLLRSAIGLSLLAAGANVVVFASGRLGNTDAPFVDPGLQRLSATAANPLPQALVLTAIVIGFSLTCLSVILVLAIRRRLGVADSAALQAAEGVPGPADEEETDE
ncbi:MAG: NADH-quinone oxidoreductase subunit K [Acidobacteriota bacterium]|nr:NADH-quinone oxidoreductase subunit K [Acidobacteriota bacterium]